MEATATISNSGGGGASREKKRTLQMAKVRYAVALYDFLGSTDKKTLTIFQGDIIRVREVTDAPWWLAECNGVLGFVPTTYVALKEPGWNPDVVHAQKQQQQQQQRATGEDMEEENEDEYDANNDGDLTDDDEDEDDVSKAYSVQVVGTYNFDKKDPRHLPYRKGDKFYIVEPLTPDQPWFEARLNSGETGLVPANRVYVLKPGETEAPSNKPGKDAQAAASAAAAATAAAAAATPEPTTKKSLVTKFPDRGIALKDFRSNELNFTRGDVLDVEPLGGGGEWISVRFNGKIGPIPRHYVRILVMGSGNTMEDPMEIKNEFLYDLHTGNTQPDSLFSGAGRDLRSLPLFAALFALKQTGGLGRNVSVEDEAFSVHQRGGGGGGGTGKRVESQADLESLAGGGGEEDARSNVFTTKASNRLSMIVNSVRQRAQSQSSSAAAPSSTASITTPTATSKARKLPGRPGGFRDSGAGRLSQRNLLSNLGLAHNGEEVTDKEVKIIRSQLRFHFFPEGSEIPVYAPQGNAARQLYVVLEGEVTVKVTNVNNLVFTPGDFFGMETLLENKRRQFSGATCTAKNAQTILLSLSYPSHVHLSRTLPWWEDAIRGLHRIQSGAWLGHLPLFHTLDPNSLDILGARTRVRQFKKGQALEPGEEGGLYVVFTGLLQASVKLPDGSKRELRRIGCGQFFAENTLFSQGVTLQTNTTCTALTNQVMTLYLSNADMEEFSASFNNKARYNVARVARFRTGQILTPLPFAQILESKLDILAQAFEFALFEKDGEVIYEDSGNQCMYLLCEGEVELVQKTTGSEGETETHKTTLRAGMWFGEKCLQYSFAGDLNTTTGATGESTILETASASGSNGALCVAISYDTFARFLETVAQEFRPQVKQKIESMVEGLELSSNTTMQFKNQLPTSADELACTTQIPVEFLAQDAEANAAVEAWAEIGSILAPCLKVLQGYPQYMHPFPFDFGEKDPLRKFLVTVLKVDDMDSVKVHTSAAETVAQLVGHVFDKIPNLDPAGPSVFGLKVASRAEYLVERDVELGRYKCITSSLRRGEVLKLQLVDLRMNPKAGPGLRNNKTRNGGSSAQPNGKDALGDVLPVAMGGKEGTLMEAVALYDYDSNGGMSFKKGDRLEVEVRIGETMWPATLFTAENVQVVGLVPQNYIKALGPIYVAPNQKKPALQGGGGGGQVGAGAKLRGATSTTHTLASAMAMPIIGGNAAVSRHQHTLLESANNTMLLGVPSMSLEEWAQTVSKGFSRVESMPPCWGKDPVMPSENVGAFPFRIRLRGLDRLQNIPRIDSFNFLQIRIEVVYAGLVIEKKLSRPMKKSSQTLRFEDEWLYFSMLCGELPLTTRLCLTLVGSAANNGNGNGNGGADGVTMKKMASTMGEGGNNGLRNGDDQSSTTILENEPTSARDGGGGGGGMFRLFAGKKTKTQPPPSLPPNSSPRLRSPSNATVDKPLNLAEATQADAAGPSEVELAGVSLNLWRSDLTLKGGMLNLGLWPGVGADRSLYCVENYEKDCSRIAIELDTYVTPMRFKMPAPVALSTESGAQTLGEKKSSSVSIMSSHVPPVPASASEKKKGILGLGMPKRQNTTADAKKPNNRRMSMSVFQTRTSEADKYEISNRVRELLHRNPLQVYQMTEADKQAIWAERELLKDNPMALSKVMISVNWLNPQRRNEALALLQQWAVPAPMQALELLDARFGEYRVREYAVKCLEVFDDEELSDFLLQLIQVLKFELFHDSPLCRFLFRRALANPREIGNKLFWGLRSEMHVKKSAPRFGLILKAYLKACGHHFAELAQQHDVQELLIAVGRSAQNLPKQTSKADRTAFAQQGMAQVNERLANVKHFQLPLEPKMRGQRFLPNKCRIMSSKKKPMWFTLENVDPVECGGEPISLMLKCGDDLRQDQMTLQIFRVLEQIWLAEGMNLRLSPYGCISTGDEVGLLEIVKDSSTIAEIEVEWGGKFGSFKESPISMFLEHHNKQNVDQAIDNFVHSCAGYCVAAYVIGLGDRHNGNLMVAKDGRFFHIDFGHFLGNFKTAIGGTFKRERTPFVLTKGMIYAMGTRYPDFVELSCRALNIIRSHGDELVTLFRLMVPAGMPELQNDEDIQYLVDQLHLGKSDEETTQIFQKEIKAASGDFYKLVDNWLHTMKHH